MRTDRERHHFITDEHRFQIVRIILGHAEQLPTSYEIAQFCPDLDEDAVEASLAELESAEFVREVTLAEEDRRAAYPDTFYAITDHGWRFLLNHNLLDSDGVTLRWEDVDVEDPERLARHESAPRPDTIETVTDSTLSSSPGELLEEYQLVVEQSRDALYMLDADGRYLLVNEAYEDLTGFSRDELLGASTSLVLDVDAMTERRELIVDLLNEASDRESHTWQSTLHTADDEAIPVEVNFAAIEVGGELVGIVGSARDISNRRRRQQELSVLSRVLRHNLSNKVNVIQGYAEVIERQLGADGPREYAERIQRNASKLIQQSEKARDIHDLLQAWPPDRHPVELTGLVWEVVTELESDFTAASFATDVPDSAWVRLPDEFEKALAELLLNAVEHAEGDDPEIRVRVRATEGGQVVLEVADDGPGIPGHEQRVITRNEETPLSHSEGLGLWLVNWIVEAAKGDITFHESDLGGSCVRIHLAASEPPALTLSM
jgi:PAS domain S-box-containing protein